MSDTHTLTARFEWSDLQGCGRQLGYFRRALELGRLASTFLFVGPPGIGKRTFAERLAQCLFCPAHADAELLACGYCPSCQQIAAGTHPDLIVVQKPEDKAYIPIELLIGPRENRNREGLCHDLSLKPSQGGRRVAILDDADHLNIEGANSLLKTLEEPPPRSLLFLIGTSEQRQLPTIRSRCQIVRFQPLPIEVVESLLVARGVEPTIARRAALRSGGSLEEATPHTDGDIDQFLGDLLGCLADSRPDSDRLVKLLLGRIESVKDDAAAKRVIMRQAALAAEHFYSQLVRGLYGVEQPTDEVVGDALRRAARWWRDPEAGLACVERCLEAVGQVEANANPANWVEAFADDLWRLASSAPRR